MDYNNILLLGVAVLNAITAFLYWETRRSLNEARKDIRTIELATNSMKDALVRATADASLLTGQKQGRDEGRAELEALQAKYKDHKGHKEK